MDNDKLKNATGVRDFAYKNNIPTIDARFILGNAQLQAHYGLNKSMGTNYSTFFEANKKAYQKNAINSEQFEFNNHLNMLGNHAKHYFYNKK